MELVFVASCSTMQRGNVRVDPSALFMLADYATATVEHGAKLDLFKDSSLYLGVNSRLILENGAGLTLLPASSLILGDNAVLSIQERGAYIIGPTKRKVLSDHNRQTIRPGFKKTHTTEWYGFSAKKIDACSKKKCLSYHRLLWRAYPARIVSIRVALSTELK